MKKKKYLFNYFYYKTFEEKIKKNLISFKNLKKRKNKEKIKKRFVIQSLEKSVDYKFKNLVRFVIGISANRNNVVVYVTDIKGKLFYYKTSGMLGLLKKQKKRSVHIILRLLKILISDNQYLKNNFVSVLHLKNINKKLSMVIIKFLSKNFVHIKNIKLRNHQPHNGCRPKKIRRKKRKKISFEIF